MNTETFIKRRATVCIFNILVQFGHISLMCNNNKLILSIQKMRSKKEAKKNTDICIFPPVNMHFLHYTLCT